MGYKRLAMGQYKTSKTRYTATYKEARYVGSHPHIKGTKGVYYWHTGQQSFVYRPDDEDDTKRDWYRVHKENLMDYE